MPNLAPKLLSEAIAKSVMVMVLGLAAVWVGCDRVPAPKPTETAEEPATEPTTAAAEQPPYAQESDPDRKLLAQLGAKAEAGDASSQVYLGHAFFYGDLGLATNTVEAVKWFRKAAEQNHAEAQYRLGYSYSEGRGVAKDEAEAAKWWRKAAEQNLAVAQCELGSCYFSGRGIVQDGTNALYWFQKAADKGNADAQHYLGLIYEFGIGRGGQKDLKESSLWYLRAASQGAGVPQIMIGQMYEEGAGVMQDFVEAYRWFNIAAASAEKPNLGKIVRQLTPEEQKVVTDLSRPVGERAKEARERVAQQMTREQIAEAQRLAARFRPRKESGSDNFTSTDDPTASGTGFFISADGFLITNEHVVRNAAQVRLVTSAGLISAKVVRVDAANDLALLKAEGKFAALPVVASRSVRLGATVATVGFPNIGLQGFAPKLAKGEVAALSGAQDDVRYFQISVPVQPGNSGGALVDERGNVVGVVAAKLSMQAAFATSGALPENVNYAVKSSLVLSFLESVPEVSAKLKETNTKDRKFEDVVKSAEQAAVLVLVY